MHRRSKSSDEQQLVVNVDGVQPEKLRSQESMIKSGLLSQYKPSKLNGKQQELKQALLLGDVPKIRQLLPTFAKGELDFNLDTQLNMWNPSPLNALVRPEDGISQDMNSKVASQFLPGVDEATRLSLVELCLQSGATPDWYPDRHGHLTRNTAAFQACYGGRLKDLKLLQQYGADLKQNAKDFDISGITLIMAAASDARLAILKYLVEQGCDPCEEDSRNRTALHWVMLSGKDESTFNYLVDNGCDPYQADVHHQTPFSLAIEFAPVIAKVCMNNSVIYKGRMYGKDVFKMNFYGFELDNEDDQEPCKVGLYDGLSTHPTKATGRKLVRMVSPIELAVVKKRLDLFDHPLLVKVAETKWSSFCMVMYLLQIFFYSLFVVVYSYVTANFRALVRDENYFGLWSAVVAYIPLFLWSTILPLKASGFNIRTFFSHSGNLTILVHTLTMIPALVMIVLHTVGDVGNHISDRATVNMAAISIMTTSFRALEILAVNRQTGPLVITIRHMMIDMARFGMIFLVMYLGFVHTFFLIIKDTAAEQSYLQVLLGLYVAVLGNWEIPTDEENRFFALAVFMLWLIVATFGLLNILIALFSNTFNVITEESEKRWRHLLMDYMFMVQGVMPRFVMKKYCSKIKIMHDGVVREEIGKFPPPPSEEEVDLQIVDLQQQLHALLTEYNRHK